MHVIVYAKYLLNIKKEKKSKLLFSFLSFLLGLTHPKYNNK